MPGCSGRVGGAHSSGWMYFWVHLRRASFHIQLGGDDAFLGENSGHLFHLAAFHRFHQPVIVLVPVCVLAGRRRVTAIVTHTHAGNIFRKHKKHSCSKIQRQWGSDTKVLKTNTSDLHARNGLKMNKRLPRPDMVSTTQLESVHRSTNHDHCNSCLRVTSSNQHSEAADGSIAA